MKKDILFLILLILLGNIVQAQSLKDSIVSYMERQIAAFPQEKMYVHNDKLLYIAGENVWFRAHIVDAISHKHAPLSLYVYGELINPQDSIISRQKVLMQDEVHSGYFKLDEELPAGIYTMRFYTKYMQSIGEDYFFQKNIYVGHPLSTQYRIEPKFEYTDDELNVELKYIESDTEDFISPLNIKIINEKGSLVEHKINDEQVTALSLNTSMENMPHQFYVEFEYADKKYKEFIQLPNREQDKFDVSFFPEGGHLMAGVQSKLAYKALNSDGLGEDVSVVLYNKDGKEVSRSKSGYKGIGMINIVPEEGAEYYAECSNGIKTKLFDLPKVQSEGYVLNMQSNGQMHVISVLSPNSERISQSLLLLIHCRGSVIYIEEWNNETQSVALNSDDLPSGLLHFMLVDPSMHPLSERLVFNRNKLLIPSIEYVSDKENYKKRSLIRSTLNISDSSGSAVSGNVSISVTDDKDVRIDSTQNIVSTLLLTSEIKGHIEEPAFYMTDTRQSRYALDLLMMTQGWKRYNIPKILQGKIQVPNQEIEQTNIISGTVKGGVFLNRDAKDVSINVMTYSPTTVNQFATDDNGRFVIPGYDVPDSTQIFITATTRKGSDRLELTLDPVTYPSFKRLVFEPAVIRGGNKKFVDDYLQKADLKYTYENGMRMLSLREVEVSGQARKKVGKSGYSSSFFEDVYEEKDLEKFKASTVRDLLFNIPKIHVETDGSITIRGRKALVLVDDYEEEYFVQEGHVDDIAEIEVFPQGTMVWGERGANGVLYISTKKGHTGGFKRKLNRAVLGSVGFQELQEFYVPKYETRAQMQDEKPDLRTTIHWEPSLDIKNGQAELEFYSSDDATSYSVVIEGVTDSGSPIYQVVNIDRTE